VLERRQVLALGEDSLQRFSFRRQE
jgi:hypothetical protein